ncbi:inactive peptidyl-prolyl cis-trans isomerase FKBP6 [Amyelois transitella]|uniref:inactive peptidyl-prolyl cis-trans isomerase FKBP6 n=1 Tax=Amyelois transitella TaxID=680683 RepID=UPI00067B1472|nr:inactive peptidyl-prolyl cis-trans isomerase FKBP6 [Amyelois transitella]
MESKTAFALEDGIDLRKVVTTGSVLQINLDYDDTEYVAEAERAESKIVDIIGSPVMDFKKFEENLTPVDTDGFVKKKIMEEGGGLPLHEGCTVSIAFSGYWECESEPFDMKSCRKPMVVDLKENGLLPGLQTAIMSMLVGEMSVFLLSHQVMYGEMGIPPRIRPKASCVFYIKLVRSILTPKEGKIDFSESNLFKRIYKEVTMLYSSGVTLHKSNNTSAAIQLFKKAVNMLHKCRLADETEEKIQEKMLIKLYINLAVCYNKIKQPLRACTACNELNRLNSLWNNGKALFHNAKSLRMIGEFDGAEKRLKRAMKLCTNAKDSILKEFNNEYELLEKTRNSCNQNKLLGKKIVNNLELISDDFKKEFDTLIKNFKENSNLCKLKLPKGLNSLEIAYVKESCIRNNVFFSIIKKDCIQDNEGGNFVSADNVDENFALDKDKDDDVSTENEDSGHCRG